jgi:hypothetical protein
MGWFSHGTAGFAVSAIDEIRLPAVSGDGEIVASLQAGVSPGVVAVVVGVDDEMQVLWQYACFSQQPLRRVQIAAETRIYEHRLVPADQDRVRTRVLTLEEYQPVRSVGHPVSRRRV